MYQQSQDAIEQSSDNTVLPEDAYSEDESIEEVPIENAEDDEFFIKRCVSIWTLHFYLDSSEDNTLFEDEDEVEDDGSNEIEYNEYEY